MKILIVRNSADKVNIDSYNLQEIGLAKALVQKGHSCDIVYYTDEKVEREEYIYFDGYSIKIYWLPAISFKGIAIYPKLINKKFLDNYDIIQTSEYFQLMTYILSKISRKPIILYHGPYKDFNNKKLQNLYDFIFLKGIIKNVSAVISKSCMATRYLKEKGFERIHDIGVGLDVYRFSNNSIGIEDNNIKLIVQELINNSKKIILYVGRLDEQKNIKFLMDTFKMIYEKDNNTHLLIVGKQSNFNTENYIKYAETINIKQNITHIDNVNQNDLKFIYGISKVFVFPSKYEIFGMVLLESMFFGLPVITSMNGGSSKVINSGFNGIIIEKFDEQLWSENIIEILNNSTKYKMISENAKSTIRNRYTWDKIVEEYLDVYSKSITQDIDYR